VQRKTNFLHDNARIPTQATPHQQQQQQDQGLLHQINEGVKNFKFEIANMINRV